MLSFEVLSDKSCFVNAILQALASCPSFYYWLKVPRKQCWGSGSAYFCTSRIRMLRVEVLSGNSCFVNAILQALASCPSFYYWLKVPRKQCWGSGSALYLPDPDVAG
jgi:hypothetical protein